MRKSSILLSVVAVASVAASVSLWMELRAARARNAELSARLDAASEGPAVSGSVVSTQVPKQEMTPPPAANLVSADSAALAPPQAQTQTEEDWEAARRRHLRDPKFREAWREERRITQGRLREDMIELIGFTPEQADKVIELSIDAQLRGIERTIPNPMTEEHERQIRADDEAAEKARQDKLRELLGVDGAARLQAYFDSRPTRNRVRQLRDDLAGADMLRDDQVEPLVGALEVERSRMQRELEEYRDSLNPDDVSDASARKYSEHYSKLLKESHGRMRTSAAAILSHSQLEKLDTLFQRERERHDAEQRIWLIEATLENSGKGVGQPD